jgi:hypothetical protein
VRGDGQVYMSGNVGIGTTTPADMLDVKLTTSGSTGGTTLRDTYPFARLYDAMGGPDAGTLDLLYQNTTNVKLSSNGDSYFNGGNIGIGTTNSQGYKLAVNGTVIATSMTVKLYTAWPDYVFKPTYHLPSLTEVKTYINENKHLPDMPSEQEVAEDGINLGELVKLQTKKIEELTLYLIEKEQQIKEIKATQQTENQRLQEQLKAMQDQLNSIINQKTKS